MLQNPRVVFRPDGGKTRLVARASRRRTRWLLRATSISVLGAVMYVALMGVATGQTGPPATSTTSSATTSTAPNPSSSEIDQLNQRIDDLRFELNAMLVLLAILAGGGVVGLFASIGGDRRAERRAVAQHDLAISGETASQSRASESYAESQRTVTLVNDTLELARLATERAATTLKEKAILDSEELDADARGLLDKVLIGDRFKDVVERLAIRGPLIELANEIGSREGYIRSQDLDLSPLCLFVKGMGRHLEQQSSAAIKHLREAARNAGEDTDLAVFAEYWMGYEQNNVNLPGEARNTFRHAAQAVSRESPRYVELSRIAIESEFFEIATQGSPANIATQRLEQLDRELGRLEDEANSRPIGLEEARASIALLRGNLWYWAAQFAIEAADANRTRFLDLALQNFENAQLIHPSLWSRFGALEAEFVRSGNPDTDGYLAVEVEARQRLANRREPRSMALLGETRFIALCRADVPVPQLASAYRDARDKLEDVDDQLTLYSQLRKHNVPWSELSSELDELKQTYAPDAW